MNEIEKNKSIALQWIQAFVDHDVEKLLSLYDEQAEHYSPKLKIREPLTNGLIKGKSSMRSWWQDAFDHLPSLFYELTNLIADDRQVVMEYTRKVKGEHDIRVAELLEIDNGLIIRSRVYHG